MKHLRYIFILLASISSCQSQSNEMKPQHVGGPCEGCEAIFEYGTKKLMSVDTLPYFQPTEPKLRITGTVFLKNGKTPAKNVILYIYQTNRTGIYPVADGAKGWARRHGKIRGWVKTDANGKYTFYTFRPASYPNRNVPEHIHLTVKEPDKNEYYLDDYVFDDDPMLTKVHRQSLSNRGGSGIGKPILKNGIITIQRDIVLGLNIPDYY